MFISREHAERMAAVTAAVETVVALPAYREAALAYAPEIARHDPGARGVFLGLDFHLSVDGPKLIEINTNAGGAPLAGMLAEAQRACGEEVRALMREQHPLARLECRLWEMFLAEWRAAGRDGAPRTVAIVDDDPPGQYLYPEFLLFERFGLRAFTVDPAALAYRGGALRLDGEPIDLVYNRLTDFALQAPGHAALRAAYLERAAVITPHPRAHALFSDKRNLVLLADEAALRRFGASAATIETLVAAIPRTETVRAGHAERLWADRKRLFFKPYAGYESRGAYRGDKLTRRVFEEIIAGGYVAQSLVPPAERIAFAKDDAPLKFDVRNYAYAAEVQLLAARLWRGQTTNFRSAGGGFAPRVRAALSAGPRARGADVDAVISASISRPPRPGLAGGTARQARSPLGEHVDTEGRSFMASTRTAGITVDGRSHRTIDKERRGARIFARLGFASQDEAERRLAQEIERLEWELERRIHARPVFSDCAKRFLLESKYKRSASSIAWHVEMLLRCVGHLEVRKVHDDTLRPFVDARLAEGVSATTINRSLEVVRAILHRASRAYRDDDGLPWLELAPPLITMLPENPRPPHPISWDEQDRIFQRLPARLAHMALFAVNTGLRDSNLCGLRWVWEVPITELGRSVFVIPREAFKSRRAHVVILNDAAWSIVESQRGRHPDCVFSYRGRPVRSMNNTAWRRARREAELPRVRVHDLRHTFATRLRAAGVHEEDRAALLGHAWRTMPEHYASADVRRLVSLANRVLDRVETTTILRVATAADAHRGPGAGYRSVDKWSRKGPADRAKTWLSGPKRLNSGAPGRI